MTNSAGERRETASVARSTPKAGETRRRILESAMGLFRERGFEPTTMREIASQAGVAIGAAYYYFDSKEALVIAFYQQAKDDMHQQIQTALADSKDLRARLQAVIDVKLRYFAPSRNFLGALFRHAADPEDPLSPFSEQTRDIRELDIQHFAEAMNAADIQPPDDLRLHLPKLLWLYQMGLILFWIYDRSGEQARTRLLLAKSLTIVTGAIKMSKLPLMRPLRRSVIELLNGIADPLNSESRA